MSIYVSENKDMNVPKILQKVYTKTEPIGCDFPTSDLPRVGDLYRDNLTGFVWRVYAHSIEGTFESSRQRIIILKAEGHKSALMHVTPEQFVAEIPAQEHYEFVRKDALNFERFSKVSALKKSLGFWKREKEVEGLSVLEALKESRKGFYVLNTHVTKHGLTDLLLQTDARGGTSGAKIGATWAPQNLSLGMTQSEIENSKTLLEYVRKGFVLPISEKTAKRIMNTPEYAEEVMRIKGLGYFVEG